MEYYLQEQDKTKESLHIPQKLNSDVIVTIAILKLFKNSFALPNNLYSAVSDFSSDLTIVLYNALDL